MFGIGLIDHLFEKLDVSVVEVPIYRVWINAISETLKGNYNKAEKLKEKISLKKIKNLIEDYQKQVKKLKKMFGKEQIKSIVSRYNTIVSIPEKHRIAISEKTFGTEKLVEFVRKNTDIEKHIRQNIKKLKNRELKKRQEAMKKLRNTGKLAEPELRENRNHKNPEVRSRIQKLLREIGVQPGNPK